MLYRFMFILFIATCSFSSYRKVTKYTYDPYGKSIIYIQGRPRVVSAFVVRRKTIYLQE